MYKDILICTDGSELAQKAVVSGLELAKKLGARATAVTVTESWAPLVAGDIAVAFPVEEYEAACAANAQKILDDVKSMAKKLDILCETVHVPDRFPGDGIIETAKSRGCDLIVMASHGRRGIPRLILGSQANWVVTHSTVPVMICR